MAKLISQTDREVLKKVIEIIMLRYHVSHDDFISSSRQYHLSHARFMAYYILHTHFGFSYPSIASVFQKDHTTIIYGAKKIEESDMKKEADEIYLSTFPQA